jgi:acetyl esterase/lipase
MRKGVQKYGYACISADYRLAPQVGVAEILEDVKDCVAYIRNELTSEVDHDAIDVSSIAVSGSSAGGYLALLAGLYVEDIRCLAPIYPITDREFYRTNKRRCSY